MPAVIQFVCALCQKPYPADRCSAFCDEDGGILYARYDDVGSGEGPGLPRPDQVASGSRASAGIWRYAPVLPSFAGPTPSLGEGGTPLLGSRRYPGLLIKDEGAQPQRTTEVRGLALAVAAAHARAAETVLLAGSPAECAAMAACAAAFRMRAEVVLPSGSNAADAALPVLFGAALLPGSSPGLPGAATVDVSTGKEPFRLEGMKTLGYELAEQLDWQMPAAIVYPQQQGSLGGVALLKALRELVQLGWCRGAGPRVYIVERTGAVLGAAARKAVEHDGATVMRADDDACAAALRDWGAEEGMALSLPGAAAAAAFRQLCAEGVLHGEDRTVLVNPCAASLDMEALVRVTGVRRRFLPSSLPVGGIITPV